MRTAPQEGVRSYDKLLIGGRWKEPSGASVIDVISPTTEQTIAHVPEGQPADIDAAVAAARFAFDRGPWPRMFQRERAAALRRVRDEVEARLPEMSEALTTEIGAPRAASRGYHDAAVRMWQSAIDLLESYPFSETRETPEGTALLVRMPVGVVGTITPWNAPVPSASMKLPYALAAGCTVVLKPAPEGPVSAMMLAEAIAAAELPDGVVSVIPAGREVGEHLVRHADVDKVAFTGSTVAGRRIMSLCGERVARVTLELGGKSAGIIADDIDLEAFLGDLVFAGIDHSGQVCAALTRVLVPRHRHDEVVDAIAGIMRSVVVGDPTDPDTVLGPLAAERQRDRVEGYVALGIEEGAKLIVGGRRPPHLERGWFYEPTLFAEVDNSMRIAQEEIFGPVLCVIPFEDTDDAIRIANDSIYGLSGAVYATDLDLAARIAHEVRAGQMWVNTWGMCITEPFGGFKQSGLGREGGIEGMAPYLEPKLIEGLEGR
jgi:acyl-CoA reductase-like NAD-dependent aldehyde dehydrogenase